MRRGAMRAAAVVVAIAGPLSLPGSAAPPDRTEIAASFAAVVFDPEYAARSARQGIARRFAGPVRLKVVNQATVDRSGEAADFVRDLAARVPEARIVPVAAFARAEVTLRLVDRADYPAAVVALFGPMQRIPGKCLARVVSRGGRIVHAEAIIVTDEGEDRFRRCLVEETLQTLGPLADRAIAADSVFNNGASVASLTDHDVLILRLLYQPEIRPGMTRAQIAPVLPGLLDALLTEAASRR